MWHKKSRRRLTGGKRKRKRKSRKHNLGRESILCKKSDSDRRKILDVRGNNEKIRLRTSDSVNVTDPDTGETALEKIENVLENPANPHFVRRGALTKGTVVETEGGKAKITSRPGQDGQANAVRVD